MFRPHNPFVVRVVSELRGLNCFIRHAGICRAVRYGSNLILLYLFSDRTNARIDAINSEQHITVNACQESFTRTRKIISSAYL